MKIQYVVNDWGHHIPIQFEPCCEYMTRMFDFTKGKPYNGFWMEYSSGNLYEYNQGSRVGIVTRCWMCHKDIEMIERKLKDNTK